MRDTENGITLHHVVRSLVCSSILRTMVTNQTQGDERQRLVSLETRMSGIEPHFDFDSWAVAVRRQMLAALKKRESSRTNWS